MDQPELLPLGAEAAISSAESAYLPDCSGLFRVSGAHCRRVPLGWSYPRHGHRFFELNCVLEGRQITWTESGELEQGTGDLLVVAPGELHASRNGGGEAMAYACLHFDCDDVALRRVLCSAGTLVFEAGSPVALRLAPVFARLVEASRQPPAADLAGRLSSLSLLCEVLSALAAGYAQAVPASSSLPPRQLQMAETLATAIAEQIARPQGEEAIEVLIRRLGYGPARGQELFSAVYGLSPRQYRSRLKLARAKELLLDPQRQVGEVGELLGYADPAHFSRQFKRWTGLSPKRFRLFGRD